MADASPPIRILPMSPEEFPGRTIEEVQSEFFLTELPFQKGGEYDYRTSGLDAAPGTIVLFQFNKRVIASAVFKQSERFDQPKDGIYRGALHFDIDSIRVFNPVGPDLLHDLWPAEFNGFGNAKSQLNAEAFPEFERRLTGIDAPARPAPPAHDLAAPPTERAPTTISRIVRDTQLSLRVKGLHAYRCQILTCGFTLVRHDGTPYAEGHHVRPLGAPHNGQDISGNILCLCPNHHAACDLGAIPLVAAELRQVPGHAVAQEFIDYHNREIYSDNHS